MTHVKMNEKTSINSIYPNLWASLLQGLTVMQQCVYQMKFRNVQVKKWLVQPGLVWSRTSCLCSHNGPTLQAVLLQAVEKWTTEWNVGQSVRNVNKMCFYALC